MTERAWRLDSIESHPPATETSGVDAKCSSAESSIGLPGDRGAVTGERGHFIARWNNRVRRWAESSLARWGIGASPFETALHEFSATIERTEAPEELEAALLRQVEGLLPSYHIDLVVASEAGQYRNQPTKRPLPSGDHADWIDRSTRDLPLRCGLAVRGHLRIWPRTRAVSPLSQEKIRRLTTLCTLGACALERLEPDRRRCEPANETLVSRDELAGAGVASAAEAESETFVGSPRLHDATFLYAVLPFALSQAKRHSESLSLVCVEIDRLGAIQELMGRAVVELLVKRVCETVVRSIRDSDIVARLDDDRVVVVLPRAPRDGAFHVAQKICERVEKDAGDGIPTVTVSIGVATFPSCADNVYALFDAADLALTQAHNDGRNRASLAPDCTMQAPSSSQPLPH